MTLGFLQANSLLKKGIKHAFFTRSGGESKGDFATLNFNSKKEGELLNVEQNKEKVVKFFELDKDALKLINQVHSNTVVIVDNIKQSTSSLEADAIVTNLPEVIIGVITADCTPILLADEKNGVIAAIHAGWRGALAGIIKKSIEAMESIGGQANCIQAVIGPTIRRSVYEVDDEFKTTFLTNSEENEEFFTAGIKTGKHFFDLPGYCKVQLKKSKVLQIEDLEVDTYTNPSQFFSCRRAAHLKEKSFGCQLSAIKL